MFNEFCFRYPPTYYKGLLRLLLVTPLGVTLFIRDFGLVSEKASIIAVIEGTVAALPIVKYGCCTRALQYSKLENVLVHTLHVHEAIYIARIILTLPVNSMNRLVGPCWVVLMIGENHMIGTLKI